MFLQSLRRGGLYGCIKGVRAVAEDRIMVLNAEMW